MRSEDKISRKKTGARPKSFFRSSERLFNLNGSWYFSTREADVGPFLTRSAAVAEVSRYAKERTELGGWQDAREQEPCDLVEHIEMTEVLPVMEVVDNRADVGLTLDPDVLV